MSESLPVLASSLFGEIERHNYSRKIRAIGIDLGTTNSVAAEATFDPHNGSLVVKCLEIEQDTLEGPYTDTLLPSVVAVIDSRIFVGEGAKRLRYDVTKYDLAPGERMFYDCKNDIGNRKTYPRGVMGLTSAVHVGAEILKLIQATANEPGYLPVSQYVLTVPASFQNSQRRETAEAARIAGIDLLPGRMIDEPIAAFIDFLRTHPRKFGDWSSGSRSVLVFDFGGGTCDIALVTFSFESERGQIDLVIHAVSRFHRLGGGDIDTSIVHQVLIPQLCEQNQIDAKSLGYQDKFRRIGPSLIGIAESLKVKLCQEIDRLRRFGKFDKDARRNLSVMIPGDSSCKLDGKLSKLSSPRLSVIEFEKILEPFLDTTLMFPRENEYFMTQSIFAPIQDALDRSGFDKSRVDYCLAVGGSSLIPQVRSALASFFGDEKLVTYERSEDIQNCVARGAAYYSLFCFHHGKAPIRQVLHDGISVRTESGLAELVSKGTPLPFPADGSYACYSELAVSRTAIEKSLELSVEIVSSGDERDLAKSIWKIDRPVNKGDRIRMEFRIDENQVLELRAKLDDDHNDDYFEMRIENPLTNVVNPAPKRLEMENLEEEIRSGKVKDWELYGKLEELADLYVNLGFLEKAIECLKRVLRISTEPDVGILNRLAALYGKQGDHESEEKIYEQAGEIDSWSGTWFNLALSQFHRKKHAEALESIETAIAEDQEASYFVLKAQIEFAIGSKTDAEESLQEAGNSFAPFDVLTDFELSWYIQFCRLTGNSLVARKAQIEARRRAIAASDKDDTSDRTLPIRLPGTPRKYE